MSLCEWLVIIAKKEFSLSKMEIVFYKKKMMVKWKNK